jgi:SPX domain protein involved in polyphosphate accumulation
MKFGKYLQENVYPDWRFYYIDYDGLKKLLKDRETGASFLERDEAVFVENLEKEMQKVLTSRPKSNGLGIRFPRCQSGRTYQTRTALRECRRQLDEEWFE